MADAAAAKALKLRGAVDSPRGVFPVVLGPGMTGVLFYESCGHGMEADLVFKGSNYKGQIGKPTAANGVTLIDDGRLKIAGIDRGFYLTVVLGLFAAIDQASGDFSIPSAGFLIEKGKKTVPVRGVTVGGNLFELLKAVDKVGSDLTWFQSLGSPTVSVSHVKIGGAGG